MSDSIVKFAENRVRRAYPGGAGIDKLHGRLNPDDGFTPEEWIASTVFAANEGMEPIKNEGLSSSIDGRLLTDILQQDPIYYLGEQHVKAVGCNTGFLLKFLDSAVRLPLQAHPSRADALRLLGSPWGKLECYYILDIRKDVDPYIWLGFQKPPTRAQWSEWISSQNLQAIHSCFCKIPVSKGDFWIIPAGLPHAIGEGVLMIEMMEPSDWVVRCEFEPVKGHLFPPQARFMGLELSEVLDIFDYTPYTPQEVTQRYRLSTDQDASCTLVTSEQTNCFEAKLLTVEKYQEYCKDDRFAVVIVVCGSVEIACGSNKTTLVKGDSALIAAAEQVLSFTPLSANSKLCLVSPKCY